MVWDMVATLDMWFTSKERAWSAGWTTWLLTVASYTFIFATVDEKRWDLVFSLATGSALGTVIIIEYLKRKKK